MGSSSEEQDREARRERAERLRKARDARNAQLTGAPADQGEHGEPPLAQSDKESSDQAPNYVDLIDQRMRELDDSDHQAAEDSE